MSHVRVRRDPRCIDPPPELRDQVRGVILALGARDAARHLGVGRDTCLAIALGLPAMPGSLSLVRESLRRAPSASEAR